MVDELEIYYLTDAFDDEYDENGEPVERREDEYEGFHIEGEAHEPLTEEDRELGLFALDDPLLLDWIREIDVDIEPVEWDDDEGPESTAEPEGY